MRQNAIAIALWVLSVLLAADTAQAQSNTPRPSFPTTNGSVSAMALDGNILYISGTFQTVGGQSRNGLAAINVDTNTVTSWNPGLDYPAGVIVVSGGTVYLGGYFNYVGGQYRNYVAALSASTGLATAWNPNPNNGVSALAVSGSTVYVGGRSHPSEARREAVLRQSAPARELPPPGIQT